MDAGVLLLIGIGGLLAALAIFETLLRGKPRRRTLADTFGGSKPEDIRDLDDEGMTPEAREALRQQMRLTAQGGVQGIMKANARKASWTTVAPELIADPQRYARMFVPKGHLEVSDDKPQTSGSASKDRRP